MPSVPSLSEERETERCTSRVAAFSKGEEEWSKPAWAYRVQKESSENKPETN